MTFPACLALAFGVFFLICGMIGIGFYWHYTANGLFSPLILNQSLIVLSIGRRIQTRTKKLKMSWSEFWTLYMNFKQRVVRVCRGSRSSMQISFWHNGGDGAEKSRFLISRWLYRRFLKIKDIYKFKNLGLWNKTCNFDFFSKNLF